MKRRLFLILGVSAIVSGRSAFAQSFADSIVAQLREQGFTRIKVERTLLGRTRIDARGKGGRREIILNPRTGEILRDLWITGSTGNSGAEGGGGSQELIRDDDSGRGRGRGRGGDDDDKDRSRDDD